MEANLSRHGILTSSRKCLIRPLLGPTIPFIAFHTLRTNPPSFFSKPLTFLVARVKPWSAIDRTGIERSQWFWTKGNGYFQEQSTRPQTLGYSLADSPLGLLAWIYEKLVEWTDGYPWEDDEGMN